MTEGGGGCGDVRAHSRPPGSQRVRQEGGAKEESLLSHTQVQGGGRSNEGQLERPNAPLGEGAETPGRGPALGTVERAPDPSGLKASRPFQRRNCMGRPSRANWRRRVERRLSEKNLARRMKAGRKLNPWKRKWRHNFKSNRTSRKTGSDSVKTVALWHVKT